MTKFYGHDFLFSILLYLIIPHHLKILALPSDFIYFHFADVPESPGPIQLIEKVPDTVTLIWEPSPTEKREGTLNYMVMRRDSYKGSWQLVSDLIYTNKCTVSNFVPGREYYFRVQAKNCMGISEPSETVQPWIIHREKGKQALKVNQYLLVHSLCIHCII